ncbi:MAG: phospholipase, partial [Chloroflexi bacterium]
MKFLFKGTVALVLGVVLLSTISASAATVNRQSNSRTSTTTTPINHLVVIFDENVSFDHYFGTYPFAQNPPGEPHFNASRNTPSVNGLNTALLMANPNLANPKRLDRSQALT